MEENAKKKQYSKELVGLRKIDYTNKQNKQVSGVEIYYTEPIPSGEGIGVRTKSEFISGARLEDFALGGFTTVLYEPYANGKYFRCVGIM